MRTDPRRMCVNPNEDRFWAVLHDAVAHPLMAITGYARFAVRFHDWTSLRAWPVRTTAPADLGYPGPGLGPQVRPYEATYSVSDALEAEMRRHAV